MIKITGKITDPIISAELKYIVKQANEHLDALKPIQRKYGIIPAGKVDGTNKIFTLPENYTNEVVYIDTTRQFSSAYVIGDRKITFNTAPSSGVVRMDYDA